MAGPLEKDWLAIDGRLEPIDFDGSADDRSPAELAALFINGFTSPGDLVFDPFAGLGTTLITAQKLGRRAIGFERDAARVAWVQPHLDLPNRVINAPIETLGDHAFGPVKLVFTSPPYPTVRLEDDPWGLSYFDDMQAIFERVGALVAPNGKIVVEVSNILTGDGFRPLVGQFAAILSDVLSLEREIVRINTSDWSAGPGVDHSSLLIFSPARPSRSPSLCPLDHRLQRSLPSGDKVG